MHLNYQYMHLVIVAFYVVYALLFYEQSEISLTFEL